MPALFNRQVILQIGQAGEQGREITGLRTYFRVQMTATSGPYEAKIRVYNPSPQTIAEARKPRAVFRLLAGYDVPVGMFRGRAVRGGVNITRQGPDTILEVEAADGWRDLADAYINISLAGRVTAQQLVDAIVDASRLPRGSIRVSSTKTWERGVSLSGYASRILDDLSLAIGSRWNVVDGQIELHPDGELVVPGQTGPVVSFEQGNLVGSPTLRANDDGTNSVEVRSLLLPGMRPFRPLRIVGRDVEADVTALDVVHEGDSGWDVAFYTDVVARPR